LKEKSLKGGETYQGKVLLVILVLKHQQDKRMFASRYERRGKWFPLGV